MLDLEPGGASCFREVFAVPATSAHTRNRARLAPLMAKRQAAFGDVSAKVAGLLLDWIENPIILRASEWGKMRMV